MTPTAMDVLQQACEHGLRLKAVGNDLHVNPGRLCAPDFADLLRAQKPALLALLRLRFVMAFSHILGETIFFCEDEDTKAGLLEAGAESWSIYTNPELRQLVQQNRIAPISSTDLRKLHQIRKTFHGRIIK
jgi:hypothetical protein